MARRWKKLAAAGVCAALVVAVAVLRNGPAGASHGPDEKLAAPAEAGPVFVVEPYLQYATRTTMTVMWETETPCSAVVEYGSTYPPKQAAKVEKADTMGEVVLSNLEPRTKNFYRVVVTDAAGKVREGRSLTFST